MTVDRSKLMDDLSLDDTPENQSLLDDLIADAKDLIRSSVDYETDEVEFEQYPIYDRAVKTLVTQLYYDRTLSEGMSKGVLMMINHLKGRIPSGK